MFVFAGVTHFTGCDEVLLGFILGVQTHRSSTSVGHWKHGGSPKLFRKLGHRFRGGDWRGRSGLTGLLSVYVFGATHIRV